MKYKRILYHKHIVDILVIILLPIFAVSCYWYWDTYIRDYWYSYNPLPLDRKIVSDDIENQLDTQYSTAIDSMLLTWYTTHKSIQQDTDLTPYCTHNSHRWIQNKNMYINYIYFVCGDVDDQTITDINSKEEYRMLINVGVKIIGIVYIDRVEEKILAIDYPTSSELNKKVCNYTDRKGFGVCGIPPGTAPWGSISNDFTSKGITLESLEPHIVP